jgi:hypothetical protein
MCFKNMCSCECKYTNWSGCCGFFCSKEPVAEKDMKNPSVKADAEESNFYKYSMYVLSALTFVGDVAGGVYMGISLGWAKGLAASLTALPLPLCLCCCSIATDTADYYARKKMKSDAAKEDTQEGEQEPILKS